jgi:RHS repeat-associated protein
MFLLIVFSALLQLIGNWYLTDRLGSVTGITDATGALINSTTYGSYGHILSQSNPAVADTLGEFGAETGLYYYRARYHNPDLGRFQSEDPIQFQAGDSNLSRYVLNSPLNYFDPKGWDPLVEQREVQITVNARAGEASEATVEKSLGFVKNRSLFGG